MRTFLARRWFDGLVLLLAAAAQLEAWTGANQTPRGVAVGFALLWTLPLLLRRRYELGAPVAVLAAVGIESFAAASAVTDSQVNPFAMLAAFWLIGANADGRRALAGGAAGYVSIVVVVLNDDGPQADAQSVVVIFVLAAGAWAIGRALAERGRRAAELQARAERLEREQETAALAERARIARELHDVIAHSLSVMTIQAGAARMLLDDDPERAREPLVAVEETGHQAIGEMRRLLGVLRSGGDESASLAPQPGLGQLDALVRQIRAAGLPVEVDVEGEPERPLPPGVDLTAYRVVQEALTNALRHAGAARAHVTVRHAGDELELEVTDTGRGAAGGSRRGGAAGDGGGHGLRGMRQRVALYGGDVEAGPRPEGGFAVRARLPTAAGRP